MRDRSWISRDEQATEALGEAIGRAAMPGLVVTLDGDLGAGKTCFVRGLARGLGVAGEVSSPTYALMATYSGRLVLHHYDAWMEGRERAFLADGGAEEFDGTGVAAIEWADNVANALPDERLSLRFQHVSPSERRIHAAVVGSGERAAAIARILASLPSIAGLAPVLLI